MICKKRLVLTYTRSVTMSPTHWFDLIHAILDQLHRVDQKMHTIGKHLGEVNPRYSDEDLPVLNEKELMGGFVPPDSSSDKSE